MIIVLFDDAAAAAVYTNDRPTVKINQTRSPYVVHIAVIRVLCCACMEYRVPRSYRNIQTANRARFSGSYVCNNIIISLAPYYVYYYALIAPTTVSKTISGQHQTFSR